MREKPMINPTIHKPSYKHTSLGWIPEDWEVKELGNVFDYVNTPSFSRENLSYEKTENEVYYIHYGDIHSTFKAEILDFDVETRVPFLKDEFCNGKLKYLKDGDLIIADASEDYEGVGACIEIKNIGNRKVVAGLHTLVLRNKENNNITGFNTYIFRHPQVTISLQKIATGISVYSISKTNLSKINIIEPPAKERNKIAILLSTWDKAISTTTQLITQKENSKKWLMQQLLTGKKRLNGFKREWNVKTLGELTEINKGEQLNIIDMINGGKYYALNGGIGPSGYTDKWNVQKDTITISEGGNSCGYVTYNKENFWCGGHCYAIENINPILDKRYLFHALKFNEANIMLLRVGSGLPNIQKKSLQSYKIGFPHTEEQRAIASILQIADEEIQILKTKLEKLKEQKKGLMQVLLTGKVRLKID